MTIRIRAFAPRLSSELSTNFGDKLTIHGTALTVRNGQTECADR